MAFNTKFSLQSFRNQVTELTESQRSSIKRAGFGNLLQIPYHVLRRNQLIELMDTWSPEKLAFIFPPGEITITLLDVSLILGLRVIGQPVVLEEDAPLTSLEEELGASVSNRTIGVELLKAKLDDIGKRDDDESFVQVFLLYAFGTLLFSSANGKVDSRYLTLVQDADCVSSFAWGAAVLKDLHDCLSQRKSKKASNMNGCLILLQIWCYEHVIIGRPKLLDSKFPRVCRWESSTRNYSTSPQFTIKFNELEPSQILWMLQPTSEEIHIDIIREIPQEWYLRTGPGTIEEPIDVESERAIRMARVHTVEEEEEKSMIFVLSDDDGSEAIEDLTKESFELKAIIEERKVKQIMKRDEDENEELEKRDEELKRFQDERELLKRLKDEIEELRKRVEDEKELRLRVENENDELRKRVKDEEELRLRVEDENDELRKRVQDKEELRMGIQDEIEKLQNIVQEEQQLRKIIQDENEELKKRVEDEKELRKRVEDEKEKVSSECMLMDECFSDLEKIFIM